MRVPVTGGLRALLSVALAASWLMAAPGGASAAEERALTTRGVSSGVSTKRRVALVIGNSRYRSSPLQNPANDARAMEKTLKSLGFDVVTALDANRTAMQKAILAFADKLANGGAGLFYYAGHGVQVRGLNYLVPIGHKVTSEASVRFEAVSLDAVLEQMGQPRPDRTNIVILDACRNNPFSNKFTGSGAGLALVNAPTDFLVGYATAPGAVALDGDENETNGVYTAALLKALKVPSLRVEDVFKRVRAEVSFKTRRKQIPWEASSLVRNFVLNSPKKKPRPKPTQSAGLNQKQVESIVKRVRADTTADIAFWNAIKDSQFEGDYKAYLEAFPSGKFAPLARLRARRYTGREPPKGAPGGPSSRATVAAVSPRPASRPAARSNARAKSGTQIAVGVFPKGGGSQGYTRGKKTFRDCPSCPEMVVVKPGRFVMGASKGDASEKPAHRVTIKKRFGLGKYPVTFAQWNACVDAGGCEYRPKSKGAGGNGPVKNLNWTDATQYTKWLSKKTGRKYRLPSEAEWEYAARAGKKSLYWWGNRVRPKQANCKDCGGAYSRKIPLDVGRFKPNPFGLHDMNGGVLEWVADCWHASYKGAPANGSSWGAANCRQRVLRGGSWRSKAKDIRSTIRFNYEASVRYYTNGLRVAQSLR